MARPTPPPRELTYVPLAQVRDDTTFRLRQPGDVSSLARSIAQAGQLFAIDVRPSGDGFQPVTGFRRLAALRLLHRDRVLARIHPDLGDEAAALVAAADALDNRALEREELLELRERYRAMGWSSVALEELIGRAVEKAEERLEDLRAVLRGEAPPDRTVVDEDALEDEPYEPPAAAAAPPAAEAPHAGPDVPAAIAQAPDEPPGPIPLGPLVAAAAPARAVGVGELAADLARRFSTLSQDLAQLAPAWDDVPPELRRIVADQLGYYRELAAWIDSLGDNP